MGEFLSPAEEALHRSETSRSGGAKVGKASEPRDRYEIEKAYETVEVRPPADIEQLMERYVVGQKQAVRELAQVVVKVKSGVRPLGNGPLDVRFLAGPSGVGKTEAVMAFVRAMAENGQALDDQQVLGLMTKIDGGEFQHSHEIARLTGSPPGYLGHRETAGLLDPNRLYQSAITFKDGAGREQRMNVVLVDEAEKANQTLHDIMLGILDKGEVKMGDGRTVDLRDSVIFFTSNVGNEAIERKRNAPGFVPPKVDVKKDVKLAYRRTFRPEYQGRINGTIIFEHLDKNSLEQILNLQLEKVIRNFAGAEIVFDINGITPQAKDALLSRGYNLTEGARAMKKVVEKEIFEPLILAAEQVRGKELLIDMDENGRMIFRISKNHSKKSANAAS